jgi:uncharacterized membrane protein
MRASSPHFFPLALPFFIVAFLAIVAAFALVQIGVIEYAYEKIGIRGEYVFSLLFLSLVGGYVNVPVADLPEEHVVSGKEIRYFGMRYVIPFVEEWPRTLIAVNLGGAIIPTLLSLYLVVKNAAYLPAAAGVLIVTVVVHRLARPLPGLGIAVPTFIPPLAAAGAGLLLSRTNAPCIAYVSGSLGTLIGADLLNLGKVHGLGAPIVSIGGAGTFDGIFLTGILAALLA